MIYFIQSSRQLKIGFSNEPASRLARCRTWRPDARLVLWLETPDDAKAEAKLKEHFSSYSCGGEWFAINLHTAVQGLIDLNLLGNGQGILEMEELPEIHRAFFDFLKAISRRDNWTEKEVKQAWREQHAAFLQGIGRMPVTDMIDAYETSMDEGFTELRRYGPTMKFK